MIQLDVVDAAHSQDLVKLELHDGEPAWTDGRCELVCLNLTLLRLLAVLFRTYWMNKLQSIDAKKHGEIFVTMNPLVEPAKDKYVEEYAYTHPMYNHDVRKLRSFQSTEHYVFS